MGMDADQRIPTIEDASIRLGCILSPTELEALASATLTIAVNAIRGPSKVKAVATATFRGLLTLPCTAPRAG
jgi:hypothetical protein